MEKYTDYKIPNNCTLCKNYVDGINKETISKLKKKIIKNVLIWVEMDETTNVDIIIRKLNTKPSKPILLYSKSLKNKKP